MPAPGPGLERLGLLKSSLIDFPGQVSAVIFTAGCNFRCPFCHNPELVTGGFPESFLPRNDVLAHLEKRKRVLDGVVLTGGEPLLHENLGELVAEIRAMGFAVKIDTNGSFPERLEAIAPDFVAVDLKCAKSRYHLLTPIEDAFDRLVGTVRYVIDRSIPHEFRTTVVPGLVDLETIRELAQLIEGSSRYVLNEFRPGKTLDPALSNAVPYPARVYEELRNAAIAGGVSCSIRGPSFTAGP